MTLKKNLTGTPYNIVFFYTTPILTSSQLNLCQQMSYMENNGNDMPSLGSNAASDVSWEQIDEADTKMTRWIPDHAVTHCAECDRGFGFIYRKHHCRFVHDLFIKSN